ncbi:MAG: cell division protein FtsK, partial [Mycobacterium sp.]|nr:cell division protein FtsK [Mycobacterium sp.]
MHSPILIVGAAGLVLVVWLLHKIGKALKNVLEVLAAAAVVFVAIWWLIKFVYWLGKQIVTHPRTVLALIAALAWYHWLGWPSLAITVGVIAVGLLVWWRVDVLSFDRYAGRHLRAWWLRWTLYARRLPKWLHACGLSIKDDTIPVDVTVSLVGRGKTRRNQQRRNVQFPKVLGVKSGPSWDEVRVKLVPGQTPEDFDEAARPLASARKVSRCQVREIEPNIVSIDFQRRNLLANPVPCKDLAALSTVDGSTVDLRKVFAGRTEYGTP